MEGGGRRIVITGSTRGLGFCLARELLSRGCAVMVSGRTWEAVDAALVRLRGEVPDAAVYGMPCDAGIPARVEALWAGAVKAMGGVDHWICNAGIGQPTAEIWEVEPSEMEAIVRTDLLGVLYGARTAMRGMLQQRSGAIWFLEGHGSDGRIMRGLSVYGAAKRAVRYVARALAVEAAGTGILVGALSPGIMITDFTMSRLDRTDGERRERTVRVFNTLGDTPETVAAFLAPRILDARKTGMRIAWLTGAKIAWRFMTAPLARRRLIED